MQQLEKINLCVIRTERFAYPNGLKDGSYTGEGIFVTDVSSYGHIKYRWWLSEAHHVLSPEWNDGNWVTAPDSYCKNIVAFNEFMNKLSFNK